MPSKIEEAQNNRECPKLQKMSIVKPNKRRSIKLLMKMKDLLWLLQCLNIFPRKKRLTLRLSVNLLLISKILETQTLNILHF